MEYYSAVKKNDIMPFTATRMDLEMIRSSKVSQKKKDSYHMMSLICGIQNMTQNEPIYKAESLADVENRVVVAQGECAGGGMGWDFGISICELLYIGWINNNILLYSTGNYIQYPVINHSGENMRMNVCMCITESLCCTAEINTTVEINCTSIK